MNNVRPLFAIVWLLSLCLAACSDAPRQQTGLQAKSDNAADFSGHWELDYGQSDNTQERVNVLVRELRQQAERRSQSGQGPAGGLVINANGYNNGESVSGLVRLTDMIARTALLEIDQSEDFIRVRREEDSDLTCEFYDDSLRQLETPFGSELCGWRDHQLVFRLVLPGGLAIQHVMTTGASRARLQLTTTVKTDQVSMPFTINRVYNRFLPGERGFRCEMTLTRGRVCTTGPR